MARRSKMGRFEVWNQGSDAFKHTDLAYNLDQLDQMIGSPNQAPTHGNGDDFNNPTTTAPPATNQWLHPQDGQQIANMGNRTLYNIVRALDYNSVPLGGVMAWWRPSTAVPLPAGFVPMDGSSYTGATLHSYGEWGITTITVPDVRNKMILGAYETATGSPTVQLGRDGTATVLSDTATDGPGIGYIGGANAVRSVAHTHGVGTYTGSDHVHNLTNHTHGFTMIDHTHVVGAFTGIPSATTLVLQGSAGPYISVSSANHNHAFGPQATSLISGGPPSALTVGMPGALNTGTATAIAISGSSGSALTTIDAFTRYIGLLYIVKIRKPGPLHNTVFPVGT